VRATGLYDEVVSYDNIPSIAAMPSVAVDFAGNADVVRAVHAHLGDALHYSCSVGMTHVAARGGGGAPLPGPAPILFFAPDHAVATIKELGPKGFGEAVTASWKGFIAVSEGVVKVDHRAGLQAAADAFVATFKGEADPAVGIVVRP
jgi:Protein of unknown function (DUF2855)